MLILYILCMLYTPQHTIHTQYKCYTITPFNTIYTYTHIHAIYAYRSSWTSQVKRCPPASGPPPCAAPRRPDSSYRRPSSYSSKLGAGSGCWLARERVNLYDDTIYAVYLPPLIYAIHTSYDTHILAHYNYIIHYYTILYYTLYIGTRKVRTTSGSRCGPGPGTTSTNSLLDHAMVTYTYTMHTPLLFYTPILYIPTTTATPTPSSTSEKR